MACICAHSPAPLSACAAVCHCRSFLCDTAILHSAVTIAVSEIQASYGSSHRRMKVCTIAPPMQPRAGRFRGREAQL